ncbi:hypothetical protein EI71_00691 [Anaeroplasma bactoclasticum]|jgi:hypothetical protein|uniref:Uncharacterized protein n=1 Tax=Anaeroplasma bactoclasticum TaxID=2088 RepID=A0A397RW07_9MOLU|nr:hypothetical protein [Anaeroplasma bactoclasticum]RIA77908.1 hypothetical protein EI71_00691 [Anaeroplasma bactoclasticum]
MSIKSNELYNHIFSLEHLNHECSIHYLQEKYQISFDYANKLNDEIKIYQDEDKYNSYLDDMKLLDFNELFINKLSKRFNLCYVFVEELLNRYKDEELELPNIDSKDTLKEGNLSFYNYLIQNNLIDYFFQPTGLIQYDDVDILNYVKGSNSYHYIEHNPLDFNLTPNNRKIIILVFNKIVSFFNIDPIINKFDKASFYFDSYDFGLKESKLIEIDIS